jgi:hypothetical protein
VPPARRTGIKRRLNRPSLEGASSGAIRGLAGPAIEHLKLVFGDCLVKRDRLGMQTGFRARLRVEMFVLVNASYQRGAISLADGLLYVCRHVPNCEADPTVVGLIGRRAVEEQHVMQRGLAGFSSTYTACFSSTSTAISWPRVSKLSLSNVSVCETCSVCVPATNVPTQSSLVPTPPHRDCGHGGAEQSRRVRRR